MHFQACLFFGIVCGSMLKHIAWFFMFDIQAKLF
jgi:hypothetical protein